MKHPLGDLFRWQNKRRLISAPYLDPYDYRSFIHGLFIYLAVLNDFCFRLFFQRFFTSLNMIGAAKMRALFNNFFIFHQSFLSYPIPDYFRRKL